MADIVKVGSVKASDLDSLIEGVQDAVKEGAQPFGSVIQYRETTEVDDEISTRDVFAMLIVQYEGPIKRFN